MSITDFLLVIDIPALFNLINAYMTLMIHQHIGAVVTGPSADVIRYLHIVRTH